MKKMLLLFSHKLTQEQENDAKNEFYIDEFIYLPKNLQKIWSDINPDIEEINLDEIKEFLLRTLKKNDVVLVQGDFGAVFNMVCFCKEHNLVTIYSTTKRVATEYLNEDGNLEKKSIFKHIRFRKYE